MDVMLPNQEKPVPEAYTFAQNQGALSAIHFKTIVERKI